MKRGFRLLTALLLALVLISGAFVTAPADMKEPIVSKDQLNQPGIKIGVSTGSASVMIAEKEFSNAEIVHLGDNASAFEAVAQGKVDAYVFDRNQMQLAIDSGRSGVRLLDENMDESVHIAVGISPVSKIPDLTEKMNAFIAEKRADGTLDDMYDRWVIRRDEKMPEIVPPKEMRYRLKVGTSGIVPPYSYYVGTRLNGYDIELANRFAAWLGAEVSFGVYDYGAIIPAAATGDVDCIMANLNVTAERREALPFSDDLYIEKIGIMVRDEATAAAGTPVFNFIRELDGRRIGIQTGTTFDTIVLKALPEAQISHFNSYSDLAAALEANKIDAFPGDAPVVQLMAAENSKLRILDDRLDTIEFAFILPKTEKGEKIQGELNAWLAEIRKNGRLEELIRKWTDGPESAKNVPDYSGFPASRGTLKMATAGDYAPMDYFRGAELIGLEVDLAVEFCAENGYGMTLEAINFDGILPAVQAGKADFAAAGMAVTEERKESVLFSDPYYEGGTAMVVLKAETTGRGGIAESFRKTFIREDRWQLFRDGLLNTLLITVLSALCGTALGFGIFMLCRNGNRAANAITKFMLWLIQGMPAVVLLMVLYYIIFGNVAISGLLVAVIGFSLTFGSSVFGLLKMGVGAVDSGQYEAAYALGHSGKQTFFRIILPQALPHVMPAYKSEIVSLIKATAIVGYIAVQDLTKMGDIVRSRTYEAFFPLIAVTIIYFALEMLISALISRINVTIDPKRRKRGRILKGVKTDD